MAERRSGHNERMTQFGDLLGPKPTLLPGDDDAESALLNHADPAQVAADHPTASIAWAYLAEAALDKGETITAYATRVPDTTADSTNCVATVGRVSVPCPTAMNRTVVSCVASQSWPRPRRRSVKPTSMRVASICSKTAIPTPPKRLASVSSFRPSRAGIKDRARKSVRRLQTSALPIIQCAWRPDWLGGLPPR